jgi:Spy/CpxP family protein refolding chaperone
MKKLHLIMIAVLTLALSQTVLARHGHHNHEKHLEKMTKHLNLSEQQVEQMKAIHQDMDECREAHRQKVKEVLTEEQWEKMQKHHKGKHKNKGDKEKGKKYRDGSDDSGEDE